MTNMQLLHECRENGIDHFALRHNRRRHQVPLAFSGMNSSTELSDDFGEIDQSEILAHLESISSCQSLKVAFSKRNVTDCLVAAESSGMYDEHENEYVNGNTRSHNFIANEEEEVFNNHDLIEETWRHEYETRRDIWKHKLVPSNLPAGSEPNCDLSNFSDGSQLRLA